MLLLLNNWCLKWEEVMQSIPLTKYLCHWQKSSRKEIILGYNKNYTTLALNYTLRIQREQYKLQKLIEGVETII